MKAPGRIGAAALFVLVISAAPLLAQTSDDFFNGSILHDIKLTLHSADWLKLKETFQENTYYPADMRWVYQGREIVVRNIGIRSRGLGSRSPVKPGLRVDFDRYTTSQTFLGLKSFILDNVTQDAALIKERVTMKFFARMGEPAPRTAPARLFVNNEYIGLYFKTESIDKDFLKRVFGDRAPGDTENDGYLFEYRWRDVYNFEYLGSDLAAYANLFSPQTHEDASDEKKYRPIEQMIKAINESPIDRFESAVGQYLDLNHVLKHVALENFMGENDGVLGYAGMNNFYLYRFEETTRHRFIVWDKDNDFHDKSHNIRQNVEQNVLTRRLFELPQYRTVYFSSLTDAAVSAADVLLDENGMVTDGRGWLEREIQAVYELVRDAVHADPSKPFSNDAFEAEIERILEFARQRSAFVQAEVAIETGLSGSGLSRRR